MERLLQIAALLAIFSSCMRESPAEGRYAPFRVEVSSVLPKSLFDGENINWVKGDSIKVFAGGRTFCCTADAAGVSVNFSGQVDPVMDSYPMIYPYSAESSISGSVVSAVIPPVQRVAQGSFDPRANVSAALSTKTEDPNNHSAHFLNAGAYVAFSVSGVADSVSRVVIKARGGEKIAGSVSVAIRAADDILASGGSADSLVVLPSAGEVFAAGKYYAVLLPSESLGAGIRVSAVHSGGKRDNFDFPEITSLTRNTITEITTVLGVNFWNTWTDAASVKALLEKAREKGRVYTSQYAYYDNVHIKSITGNSRYKIYGGFPLIYGLDFFRMSGTYFDATYRSNNRKRALSIIKEAWEQLRAIPSFSWHLESPYASIENPELGENVQGASFCYQNRDVYPSFPVEHRYQVNEILENTGLAVTGQTCGDWFDSRVREVADIINSLVDSQGRPIPMIFRLWHELEDWWAWWQIHDIRDSKYAEFYRLTVDKFREYCPDAQILFVYCTDRNYTTDAVTYLSQWPGDDYVDIMGYDDYSIGSSYENIPTTIDRARVVSAAAEAHGKVAMLCETMKAAKDATNNQQAIIFQDFAMPIVTDPQVHLSIYQVWGGADNTALRKESFKKWYNSDITIFDR